MFLFTSPILILTTTIMLLSPTTSVGVSPISSCISACASCPSSPSTCLFVPSLLSPNYNSNCIPFFSGGNCQDLPPGYKEVHNTLDNWLSTGGSTGAGAGAGGSSILGTTTCNILHTGTTSSSGASSSSQSQNSFTSLSPQPIGSTLSKNITLTITNDTVQVLIVRLAITTTTATPSSSSQLMSVNMVTGNNNISLQLAASSSSINNYTNTSCGVYLQYIYKWVLTTPLTTSTTLSITITPNTNNGATPTTSSWSLSKMQVLTGCGAFMVDSCTKCVSGFYPLSPISQTLAGCGMCPIACQTCTYDKCTLCVHNAYINRQTGYCQYRQDYRLITQYQLLNGTTINNTNTNTNRRYSLSKLVKSSSSSPPYPIAILTSLSSPAPYQLRLWLVYPRELPSQLSPSGNITISIGNTQALTISGSQLPVQMGYYQSRLSNTSKYYIKSVVIDRLNQQNLNKNVQASIECPVAGLYVGDYTLVQYQCAENCAQCDRVNRVCLMCNNFLVNSPVSTTTTTSTATVSTSCSRCPNGFYYSNNSCIKCHSTCLQCSGGSQQECSSCYNNFHLSNINYNKQCINCIYTQRTSTSNNPTTTCIDRCQYHLQNIQQTFPHNPNCQLCLNKVTPQNIQQQLYKGSSCQSCWLSANLAYSSCTSDGVYTFYGNDVVNNAIDSDKWEGVNGKMEKIDCGKQYASVYGVSNINKQPTTTTNTNTNSAGFIYRQPNLPTHTGLYLTMTLIKTDILSPNQSITITIEQTQHSLNLSSKKQGSPTIPGSNICVSQQYPQMIQTFTYTSTTHTSSMLQFSVSSTNGGIYIQQLYVYLGDCQKCASTQLVYQVDYQMRYIYNISKVSGVDLYIQFNKKVQNTQMKDDFGFGIDVLPDTKIEPLEFHNDIQVNNRLHYFLPLDTSFKNGTLTITTAQNATISAVSINSSSSSSRLLLNSPLSLLQSQTPIARFSALTTDDLVSTTQIYQFFNFFQWFTLITMIICTFLGIGVVFQQFSIMLQLLFLHVYISSNLLPATYKAPVYGLARMEHLNYFDDNSARNIQAQWFGSYIHPSPYTFTQYNKDILFQRSFYPTIIINLVYLGWFILLFVLVKVVKKLQTSSSPVVGFFRNIPARPLNYADQIWRYQFVTTIWAAFMQFHILKNDTPWERFNLALCFICFIFVILWPIFVVCYTFRLNAIKYSAEFMYKYEDIYFLKMQSISQQQPKYYNYVFIRFARLFIMTLFINVFTEHEIIGPVILICVNIVQIVYVVGLHIFYNSPLGTLFKVLQNILFIAVQVCLLVVYGLSDNAEQNDFINLGYAIDVLYVIMVILGILRVVYYCYHKFRLLGYNMNFGKDNGEIVNIGPTPLPGTDRYEGGSSQFV